jgi:tryptophan synthase alpha chain
MNLNNRLTKLFKTKDKNILSIYFTAGFPEFSNTLEIAKLLDKSGVDFIEIGIPFSDSLVDGPTIQASNEKALENGMTLSKLFAQLKELRNQTQIPVILMGCLNPILTYGMDNFVKDAKAVGVDGALIADLPPEEFVDKYKKSFDNENLSFISLVTKHCNEERIKYLDNVSDGFLYVVSSDAITGTEVSSESGIASISELNCKNPSMLGFGITNNENFKQACENANGAIIGTAFIKVLNDESLGDLNTRVTNYIKSVLEG